MKNKINKSLVSGLLVLVIVIGASSIGFGQGLGVFRHKKAYSSDVFKDIKPSDWFYKDVTDVYNLDLVAGKGNNTFSPLGEVTLAETIILATNIHSQYENKEIPQLSGKWYRSGISYAIENNIIGEDDFKNYDSPATRAEVAYILSNALPVEELRNINNIKEIPDVSSSTKYSESIFKLYNSGIVRGSGVDGRFNPNSKISRGEIAALINRLVQPNKRQKFALGDLVYKNKKYGFSMVIPRAWVGHYEIEEKTRNNGRDLININLVKDGKNLMNVISIEMIPESEYEQDYALTRYNAGKNKGYMMLIERSHDTSQELERPENKKQLEILGVILDDYDSFLKSIKFE